MFVLLKRLLISLFIFFVIFSTKSEAQSLPSPPKCKSSFPNLITDICWKCIFPIRIGGQKILDIGRMPDNVNTPNIDDFNPSSFLCACTFPEVGIYVSFWEPVKVLEVVLRPDCFPFLFGLDLSDLSDGGYGNKANRELDSDKAFYHVHYYSFPLFALLDLIVGMEYCTDWMDEIDLLYFTEIDPLWDDDELTLYLNPEAIIFANPIAQAICAVDCIAATTNFPLNALFWCAGCWGSMYPFTGNALGTGSPVRTTSLLASRIIARSTRIPIPSVIEHDTSSAGAKCGGIVRPIIKKSQYKFSTIFPIPETKGKCCHTLGSLTLTWGEWRNIPAVGEYQTYLKWRKRNCCLKLL